MPPFVSGDAVYSGKSPPPHHERAFVEIDDCFHGVRLYQLPANPATIIFVSFPEIIS
jgi:hypothetical protein